MIGFFSVFLAGLGLGALLPGPRKGTLCFGGVRFLCGLGLVMIGLYAGNVVLGVPLGPTAWAVLAVALFGVGLSIRRMERPLPLAALATHPLTLLPLLIAGLALAGHRFAYVPYLGDEFTSWAAWARMMVVADHAITPEMRFQHASYTPGWPLLMAFPGFLVGRFAGELAAPIQALMHVGLMAVVFDAARWLLRRYGAWPRGLDVAFAWLVVLALLAVEATWKLVPTSLLVERPQVYFVSACFVLGLLIQYPGTDTRRLALAIGVLVAAGYLVKVAMVVFLVPLAVLGAGAALAACARDRRSGAAAGGGVACLRETAVLFGLLFLPFALVFATWTLSQSSASCLAQPQATLSPARLALLASPEAGVLARRLMQALWAYAASYKAPLSALALAGVAAGFTERRTAAVSFALVAYAAAYVAALYWIYLACFSGYELEILASHQRYFRVLLRVFHLVGLLVLAVRILDAVMGRYGEAVLRLGGRRRWRVALASALVPLAGWQAWQVELSLRDMATRSEQPDRAAIAELKRIGTEAEALSRLLRERGLGRTAKVMMLAQGTNGFAVEPVRFYRIGRRRGEPLFAFDLNLDFSFGEKAANVWMRAVTPAEFEAEVLGEDVLWPVRLDRWARRRLAPLIGDPRCRADPEPYFLVRDGRARGFLCIRKSSL